MDDADQAQRVITEAFIPLHRVGVPEWVLPRLLCLFEGGSTLHGVKVDGQDDTDYCGVYVELEEHLFGTKRCDDIVVSTGGNRPNRPSDVDVTLYSLRKFVTLLDKGNPTIFQYLWVPTYRVMHPVWTRLVRIRQALIHRGLLRSYCGYVKAQRERLLGIRGQMRIHRSELVSKHGYDTKFASHALRLCAEGIEVAREHRLTLPLRPIPLAVCTAVRRGEMKKDALLSLLELWEAVLVDYAQRGPLDEQDQLPDDCHDVLNTICVEMHKEFLIGQEKARG